MKHEIDEYDLAVKARDGDANALGSLVDRLRNRLFATALAQLGNFHDAQDATANAFARICTHIGSLRQPDRLRPWADGILRNEVRRLVANRRRILPLEDFDAPYDGYEIPVQLRLDIQHALRRLPDTHAHALSLFYLDGAPVVDIASRTGQPVGTVKSWLHHGRKRLKMLLEDYGPMMQRMEQMTTSAAKRALLVQATLTPELMDRLAKGLRRRGYELHNLTEQEVEETLNAYAAFDMDRVRDWLREFDAFVFDETLTPVPTIAQIVNIRADPELRETPIFVLVDDPLDTTGLSPSTVEQFARFSMSFAYFNAGVDAVIFKSVPNADDLVFSDERAIIRWDRITPRAGRVLKAAIAEAADLQAREILPEHVLAGITTEPECLGAVLLREFNGVDLDRLRETVLGALPASTDEVNFETEFSNSTYEMLREAQAEANSLGHSWLGAEHFLAGMLRMPETPVYEQLTEAGISLSTLREQISIAVERARAASA